MDATAYDYLRLRMIITYDFPRLHEIIALKLPDEGEAMFAGAIEADKL